MLSLSLYIPVLSSVNAFLKIFLAPCAQRTKQHMVRGSTNWPYMIALWTARDGWTIERGGKAIVKGCNAQQNKTHISGRLIFN